MTVPDIPWPLLRGREEQLDAVATHLERVRSGVGAVLLVEGRAGMGKSALLREAVSLATAMSYRTGLGAADPRRSVVELAPLIDALFVGEKPLFRHDALSGMFASREQRFWVLEDIQALLERAALQDPLLICLDDVHWADGDIAFALRMLPQWLAPLPVAWVIALRPNQGSPSLARTLEDLADAGAGTVSLDPLDRFAVTEVATDILAADPDDAVLRVAHGVEGNPSLLVELLTGLHEDGLIAVASGRATLIEDRVPHRVGDSLHRRLSQLSPSAERLAILAAALGRRFSFNELAALGTFSLAELLQPLRELIDADIFTASEDRLTFGHDLIREAVRARVPR